MRSSECTRASSCNSSSSSCSHSWLKVKPHPPSLFDRVFVGESAEAVPWSCRGPGSSSAPRTAASWGPLLRGHLRSSRGRFSPRAGRWQCGVSRRRLQEGGWCLQPRAARRIARATGGTAPARPRGTACGRADELCRDTTTGVGTERAEISLAISG